MSSGNLKAVVIGASGAVGSELVRLLARTSEYTSIVLLNRRDIDVEKDEKIEQRIVNFDEIDKHKRDFADASVVFCALGTTRGSAGRSGFYKVDHDYVVNCARIAKAVGVPKFSFISSEGADENSMLFYLKTKGETERDVRAIGLDSCTVARPALLERPNPRVVERVISFVLAPSRFICPEKLFISATSVAKAMIFDSLSTTQEQFKVIKNANLHSLAALYDEKNKADNTP